MPSLSSSSDSSSTTNEHRHPATDWYTGPKSTDSRSGTVLLLPDPQPMDPPLYKPSEFQVDDVAIHFRCGDFLSDQWEFIETSTFQCYVEHIPKYVRTIGILTQPLDSPTPTSEGGQQYRSDDTEKTVMGRCRILVYSFIKYIQQHHPQAQIFIHNSRDETIALTYARMIMARV